METQLYIRVRGRVLGPYDQEKLQALARRGQLSRMHELSPDGVSWVRASNYPELFVGDSAAVPTVELDPLPMQATAAGATSGLQQPARELWHYTISGAQRGPTDFANLQSLAGSGQIGPDDLVWNDSLTNWTPAGQVPGLLRPAAGQAVSAGNASPVGQMSPKDSLPESVLRSAVGSRPWVLFVTIVIFTYAALEAIGGIFFLIAGVRAGQMFGVAAGIFNLLWAIDWAAGGFLLSFYFARLGNLQYLRTGRPLEQSLDSLRRFWIYVGINLIVHLAFIGFLVVWIVAAGTTLPQFSH